MEIKIYQINTDRDDRNCAFMDLEYLKRALGQNGPDAEIYDLVYTGKVDDRSLEDVFTRFNCDIPEDYRGRSLSVSDVVEVVGDAEVEPGFYFCDRIGFQKVEFDASRAGKQYSRITVVLLEPGKLARVAEIRQTVDDRHGAVLCEVFNLLLLEGADHDAVHIAGKHACGVLHRLATTDLRAFAREHNGIATELIDAHFKRNARSGGRLLKNHGKALAL